jgi:hypothetical protein
LLFGILMPFPLVFSLDSSSTTISPVLSDNLIHMWVVYNFKFS